MLDDFKQRGIKFWSLNEAIDTETPIGRAMWQMIGVLAELERSLIAERTRAGVKAAQRRRVKFGPKVKLTPERLSHARKLIQQGTRPADTAKIIGVGHATLYSALQRGGVRQGGDCHLIGRNVLLWETPKCTVYLLWYWPRWS
jgi:DNA invertase Pin-like site-specific DNA recombinase